MSENQRDKTVVAYKWQRERSEDKKEEKGRGKKKRKKNEARKLYMLEFSLNRKVLQKNISPLL